MLAQKARVKWWGATYEALDSVNAACKQDSGHESGGLHDCSELLFLLVRGKKEDEEMESKEKENDKEGWDKRRFIYKVIQDKSSKQM